MTWVPIKDVREAADLVERIRAEGGIPMWSDGTKFSFRLPHAISRELEHRRTRDLYRVIRG